MRESLICVAMDWFARSDHCPCLTDGTTCQECLLFFAFNKVICSFFPSLSWPLECQGTDFYEHNSLLCSFVGFLEPSTMMWQNKLIAGSVLALCELDNTEIWHVGPEGFRQLWWLYNILATKIIVLHSGNYAYMLITVQFWALAAVHLCIVGTLKRFSFQSLNEKANIIHFNFHGMTWVEGFFKVLVLTLNNMSERTWRIWLPNWPNFENSRIWLIV